MIQTPETTPEKEPPTVKVFTYQQLALVHSLLYSAFEIDDEVVAEATAVLDDHSPDEETLPEPFELRGRYVVELTGAYHRACLDGYIYEEEVAGILGPLNPEDTGARAIEVPSAA